MSWFHFFSKKRKSQNTSDKAREREKLSNSFEKEDDIKLWIKAMNENDQIKKEALLNESEILNHNNPIDLHFTYNHLIDMLYKQRDSRNDALDKCSYYCKRDIDLYPKFKMASISDDVNGLKYLQNCFENDKNLYKEYEEKLRDYKWITPRIPSFQRLAIIYEKQGEIQKAIDICNLALEYGLIDGTQGGFEGRRVRLKKKL